MAVGAEHGEVGRELVFHRGSLLETGDGLEVMRLDEAGATIVMPLVGRYATSMEMTGVSFTLCWLDDALESYLKAPAECAFWRV